MTLRNRWIFERQVYIHRGWHEFHTGRGMSEIVNKRGRETARPGMSVHVRLPSSTAAVVGGLTARTRATAFLRNSTGRVAAGIGPLRRSRILRPSRKPHCGARQLRDSFLGVAICVTAVDTLQWIEHQRGVMAELDELDELDELLDAARSTGSGPLASGTA